MDRNTDKKPQRSIEALRNGLIVSCQAENDDPFNRPEYLALFARAAEMGGAAAIRAQGANNIQAICRNVSLPVIGLTKAQYSNGDVLITPDIKAVEDIIEAGSAIIAVDATDRLRPNGMTGPRFILEVKRLLSLPVVADISTLEEGLAALEAGADAVATTLSGYTPETRKSSGAEPDWGLLTALLSATSAPVIMEGRIWTPAQAQRAVRLGAFAVVVGTAITRPRVLTRAFVNALGCPDQRAI